MFLRVILCAFDLNYLVIDDLQICLIKCLLPIVISVQVSMTLFEVQYSLVTLTLP